MQASHVSFKLSILCLIFLLSPFFPLLIIAPMYLIIILVALLHVLHLLYEITLEQSFDDFFIAFKNCLRVCLPFFLAPIPV